MKKTCFAVIALMCILSSCSSGFISDRSFRKMVGTDFRSRSSLLSEAGIMLDTMHLSRAEKEAMEFLYAYMPLGDILNMPSGYYADNCRLTMEAVKRMPWGGRVPERELRHFVLPVRVNNENLDTSRAVFFRELAPRVKDMSMYDAILEVNHWCHEKAVYQPSDSRTSSPLATVRTAYGRCGEESTLLVAALRSVCIPARQVYTPRWAHTDDNHAWVEAWADGEWYFLGACEPEPVLDLGWFNAPASRGMLMHTKVFGRYDGPEETVSVTPGYTEINVTSGYAPESARLDVHVKDVHGAPVPGATVEYRLYNYAEFYPVAVKAADDSGHSSLVAGLGDMLVYATDGKSFGFRKVTFGKDLDAEVVLEYDADNLPGHFAMESVPPAEHAVIPDVTPEQREENDLRMMQEDSIRNAYVATFMDRARAEAFVRSAGVPAAGLLVASRGNHDEISGFIRYAVAQGRGKDALAILESVSEKDLRDTPAAVLKDHLDNMPEGSRDRNVYCPRVSNELLSPYRGYLLASVPEAFKAAIREDPSCLVAWCRDSLSLMDTISMPYVNIAPARVWDTRLADSDSRDIFFVAMCRTLGIPAWKDPVTGVVRYSSGDVVYDADFASAERTVRETGTLVLSYNPVPMLDDPKYYTHFTISRYEDGRFRLLDYGEDVTWKSVFSQGASLPVGVYMLTSGSRMAGGNVLADIRFFRIDKGSTAAVELTVRDDPSQYRVIGSFNSEAGYDLPAGPGEDTGTHTTVLAETGRGYFAVVLADNGKEPTDHALRDISAVASDLEAWGRPLLVIFASESDWEKFREDRYRLPATVSYGIDTDGSMRRMIMDGMSMSGDGRLPLIVVADTFNRVVFFSQGYSVGTGERLKRIISSL